jgi:hypothetical protein
MFVCVTATSGSHEDILYGLLIAVTTRIIAILKVETALKRHVLDLVQEKNLIQIYISRF